MLTLLLASALAAPPAAAQPPPTRPFADLPVVPPREGFAQTDAQLVELVQSLLTGLVRDGYAVPVRFADSAQAPKYGNGAITLQHFTTRDAAWVRRELADSTTADWLPPLSGDWTDADLLDAWHAAHLAALANAYGQAIRDSWGRLDEAHPEAEALVARTLEGPVLDALAAEGRIPARWPALYRRLAQQTAAPQKLDNALFQTLADYPDRERDQLADTLAAFATTAGLSAPVQQHDADGPLVFTVSSDAGAVAMWSFAQQARVRAAAPLILSKGQRKKAAQVVNSWNQDVRGFTVIVQPLNVLVLAGPISYTSASELRSRLDASWELLAIITPALRGLADGASVDDTINAPQAAFEAKELYAW